MEHVDVYGGLKHYVKNSYLAEYLETRVSVEQPETIRTDSHSGYDHSDDGGDLEPPEQYRTKQNDHENKEKYGYGL